jgi:hypothetical protein
MHIEQHDGFGCSAFRSRTGEPYDQRSVVNAVPPNTPHKVVVAKLAKLIRRGLIDGCACGCRGDFEITTLGRFFLMAHLSCNTATPVTPTKQT